MLIAKKKKKNKKKKKKKNPFIKWQAEVKGDSERLCVLEGVNRLKAAFGKSVLLLKGLEKSLIWSVLSDKNNGYCF